MRKAGALKDDAPSAMTDTAAPDTTGIDTAAPDTTAADAAGTEATGTEPSEPAATADEPTGAEPTPGEPAGAEPTASGTTVTEAGDAGAGSAEGTPAGGTAADGPGAGATPATPVHEALAWADPDRRWSVLDGAAVAVHVTKMTEAVATLRALPAGTPVILAGRRGLWWAARSGHVTVEARYAALPGVATPAAVSRIDAEALRWTANGVLTVPSGVALMHGPLSFGVRLARRFPRLLLLRAERVLIGRRR